MRELVRCGWLALILLAACGPPTAVVVHIDNTDLVVPTEVQRLLLTVTNPEVGGAPAYQSQDLVPCTPGQTQGCFAFPITVTLAPGPGKPDAAVRVEVDAFDAQGTQVIADASVFTFTPNAQQRLDFYLQRACLHSVCGARDEACGPLGGCVRRAPTSATVDLASPAPAGEITNRGFQFEYYGFNPGPVVVPPPFQAEAGDLVLMCTSAMWAPAGWIPLGGIGFESCLYRRAAADEATRSDVYTFGVLGGGFAALWTRFVYRGVGTIVPTFASAPSSTQPYVFPSSVIERPGSHLVEVLFAAPPCSLGANLSTWNNAIGAAQDSVFLAAGDSGDRSFTCAGASAANFQFLLVPR